MINEKQIKKLQSEDMVQYLNDVPYDISHDGLYRREELFEAYVPGYPESLERCYDKRVYQHVTQTGKYPKGHKEMLGRSLHDYYMRKSVRELLDGYDRMKCAGIMGGHAMLRDDANYKVTAMIAKELTERGYMMLSGGGPGAMEATHFGAWMAGRSIAEMNEAIEILAKATSFESLKWYDAGFEVINRFPQESGYKSLSIPTWFYGHEPPALFATDIAKFFDNSIREDLLITEAYGGLIVMPGSAGTLQEIFQEAVQDHYKLFGFASPLILVGRKYWNEEVPVEPFFNHMMEKGLYKNIILNVVDTPEEVVECVINAKVYN